MRRKVSAISGVIVACALLAGLSGCKGSDSGQSSSQESATMVVAQKPVTMSAAFNTPSVWYASDEAPSANVSVETLFVFDGKGNVTVYDVNDAFTYGDVKDLSDEAVISRAEKADKDYFNERKQTEEKYLRMQDAEEFSEMYGQYGQTLNKALDSLENLDYKAPQPFSFELTRLVEEGKDTTVNEIFTVDAGLSEWSFVYYGRPEVHTLILYLTAKDATEVFSVGDKYFRGYVTGSTLGLYTQVDKNYPGFLLDEDASIPKKEIDPNPKLPDPCGCGSTCGANQE